MGVAAGKPSAVISDESIPVREDRLTSEREKRVRHMTSVNQQYRFPLTVSLVFESLSLQHLLLRALVPPSVHAQQRALDARPLEREVRRRGASPYYNLVGTESQAGVALMTYSIS